MQIKSLSEKMKELRTKKGFSLEEISEKIPVSKQGYHFWEQGLRSWKLETLSVLSKILDFTLTIKDGVISISENKNTIKGREKGHTMREIVEEYINLDNAIDLDDRYCIIELYTIKRNINLKEEKIIHPLLVFKSKEEVINVVEDKELATVYTLYDREIGYLFAEPNVNIKDVYDFYYNILAPELDDNRTLYINKEKNIKISKRFLIQVKLRDNDGNEKDAVIVSKNKDIEQKYEEVEYDYDIEVTEDLIKIKFIEEEKELDEDSIKCEEEILSLSEELLTAYEEDNIDKVNEITKSLKSMSGCDDFEFSTIPSKFKEDESSNIYFTNDYEQVGEGLTIYRVTDLDDNIIEGIDNIHFNFPYELLD